MKVEIRFDGTLEISAETELEGYALEKWRRNNSEKLVIKPDPIINQPVLRINPPVGNIQEKAETKSSNFLKEGGEDWYIENVCERCKYFKGPRIKTYESAIISCEYPEFIKLFNQAEPKYDRKKHCKFEALS